MKNWQIRGIRWTQYGMEMMFLYLLLFPIYSTENSLPPSIPFLVMILSGTILYGVLAEKGSVKWALLGAPVMIFLGTLLDFPVLLSAFLAVIIFWRVTSILEHQDHTSEITLFFFTLGLGLVYYFWLHSFEGRHLLIAIIFLQFILTIALKTIAMALQHSTSEEQKRNHLKWFMGSVLTVGVSSLAMGLAFPLIKEAFILGFRGLLFISNMIAMPILMLFERIGSFLPTEEGLVTEVDTESPFFERDILENEPLFDSTYAGYIAATIILLVICYIVYRKTQHYKKMDSVQQVTQVYSIEQTEKPRSGFSFREMLTPNNKVRRLFFDLESTLAKQGIGRESSQTVEDWFSTLYVEEAIKNTVKGTYEKVRYGSVEVDREERTNYKNAIKLMKKQLKEKK